MFKSVFYELRIQASLAYIVDRYSFYLVPLVNKSFNNCKFKAGEELIGCIREGIKPKCRIKDNVVYNGCIKEDNIYIGVEKKIKVSNFHFKVNRVFVL
jgi:hypothetical protein